MEVACIIQKKVFRIQFYPLKVDCINEYQIVPQTQELYNAHEYMEKCQAIINGVLNIQSKLVIWRSLAISNLEVEEISQTCDEFMVLIRNSQMLDVSKLLQSAWLDAKFYMAEELYVSKILLNPSFKTWHWEKMCEILGGYELDITKQSIYDVQSHYTKGMETAKQLKEVETLAIRGSFLEETLNTITARLNSLDCHLEPYEGNSGLIIFRQIWGTIDIIDGDILTLGTLALNGNHYRNAVNNLVGRLDKVKISLQELELMQPLMIKCFCFFDSDDVKLQLQAQNRRFLALERVYQVLINKVYTII
jgi:hypothetical protein